MNGFVCGPSFYTFKGWLFEVHNYLGPRPLTKALEPRNRAGKKFWAVYEEWDALSDSEKLATRLHKGGCTRI